MADDDMKTLRFDAVDRTVAIMRALERAEQPLPLSVIAREVGLGQPTTSRYLASLVGHRYIEKVAGGRYVLGISVYLLGQRALHRREVRVLARPKLEELHARYNETISLALDVKGEVIVIDCIEALHTLRQGASVGVQNPWHASSLGKAMLAWVDEDKARRILEVHGRAVLTPNTLTPEAVLEQLPGIRQRGFALDDEESTLGGRCVGAAIRDASGAPIGAISVSGPILRLSIDTIDDIGRQISAVAAMISSSLGFQPPSDRSHRNVMTGGCVA
jgi:IclR family transcriptional regulator, acetate operon repressor